MQKPVPSLPTFGETSEVFGCIKPVIIVLLPTCFLKFRVLHRGPGAVMWQMRKQNTISSFISHVYLFRPFQW